MRLRIPKRFARNERAAAIIEFALVVPIFFTMVWGIISFSRAYQRLNALSASLREGARVAAVQGNLPWSAANTTNVKAAIYNFSTAFGYPVDTSQVTVDPGAFNPPQNVRVYVTNYPLFVGLNFLGNLSSITVSREATFRHERA